MLARIGSILVAAWLIGIGLPGAGARADDNHVDLLLVLAADVSKSVDAKKFQLQREGYAAAVSDPRVVKAMTGGTHRRIALCFIEWADDYEQSVIVGLDADRRQPGCRSFRRDHSASRARAFGPHVDRGRHRLRHGAARTHRLPGSPARDRRVGRRHQQCRPHAAKARDEALAQGVTINGLAILGDTPLSTNPRHTNPPGGLAAYYRDNVIGGPARS